VVALQNSIYINSLQELKTCVRLSVRLLFGAKFESVDRISSFSVLLKLLSPEFIWLERGTQYAFVQGSSFSGPKNDINGMVRNSWDAFYLCDTKLQM